MTKTVDAVQFVVFLKRPPRDNAIELWQTATGAGFPQNFQQIATGGTLANGDIGGLLCTIQVQPIRIDIILNPLAPNPFSSAEVVTPPTLEKIISSGLPIALKATADRTLGRVAIIIQGSEECEDVEGAMKRMLEIVPGLPFPRNSIDALYQINAPLLSETAPGRTLFRVARWNVGKKIQGFFDPSLLASGAVPGTVAIFHTADVFIDLSDDTPSLSVEGMFQEVAKHAGDIIDNGYAAIS